MNEADRLFMDSCDFFKDYTGIDEYKRDIRQWLTLSSWKYSEERAIELIKQNKEYIEKAYQKQDPASDTGAEIGYCCG